jgi:hypothetical protein
MAGIRDVRDTAIGLELRYPYSALTDTTDYLLINVVQYIPAGNSGTGRNIRKITEYVNGRPQEREVVVSDSGVIRGEGQLYNKNTKSDFGSIILPIPSNIQDGNSVNFGPGSLDGLTASVLDYTLDTIGEGSNINLNNLGEFITSALSRATGVISDPAALAYFNRNVAASAANIPFGGNLTPSQLLARQTGNILNPNMELLFEGVNLRSFKFSFKMTPRDYKEAESVKRIIRTFKKNMTPQADGVYLKTPNIFELSYMKGANPHPFLHKFKQCALTDMSVNYTGEGTYATYGGPDNEGGGTPVSMVMDLGFKELEPIYAGDYTDDLGGVGY